MSPILFIGLDAADWELLSLKFAAGKLPHISNMVTGGVSGPLRSISPLFSPTLWTTIGTGKHAYEHGITGFTHTNHLGTSIRPYDRTARRSPAIWNMFSYYKKSSNIVGWWTTAPAEKIRGAMIDETFRIAHRPSHEPWDIPPRSLSPWSLSKIVAQDRVHPQRLSEALLRFLIPKLYEIDPSADFRVAAIAKILAEDLTTLQVTLHLMKRRPWDLTSIYLMGLDSLSHLAMCYREPALPGEKPRDCELYGNVVDRAYELYDRWIGELIEAAGEESTIVIASDHGFYHDARKPDSLGILETAPTSQHAPIGTLIMKGPQLRQGATIHHATILDLCPTLLAIAGLPIGKDMPGKVLLESFSKKPILKKISSWNSCWKAPMTPSAPSSESTKAALRQLVSLGYLKEVSSNNQAALHEAYCNELFHQALSFLHDDRLDQAIPLLEQSRIAAQQAGQILLLTDILEELAKAYLYLGEKRRTAACFFQIARYRQRDAKQALRQFWEKADSHSKEKISFQEAWGIRHLMARASLDEGKISFMMTLARFLAHSKEEDLDSLLAYAEAHPEEIFAQLNAGLFALEHRKEKKGILLLHNIANHRNEEAEALAFLATYYNKKKKPLKAEECSREAIRRNPLHRSSWLALATSLMHQARWSEAQKAAQEAQKSLIQRSDACAILAHIALEGKKNRRLALRYRHEAEKAKNVLQSMIHLDPLPKKREYTLEKKSPAPLLKSIVSNDHNKEAVMKKRSSKVMMSDNDLVRKSPLRTALKSKQHSSALVASAEERDPTSALDNCYSEEHSQKKSLFKSHSYLGPIIVTGLPRSGTSLVMQMLAAGGITVDTDHHRRSDGHNPQGYFEHEKVKTITEEARFLKDGVAIKVVIPLAFHLPHNNHYRIIWIHRSLEEVITSQHRMAGPMATVAQLHHVYRHYEITMAEHIREANWPLLSLDYSSVVQSPHQAASSIAHFLKKELPITAMATAVIPSLYRVKKESIVKLQSPSFYLYP
ncbi:MAG: alkaline phosphatase family protein [Chthoniobacterales bacterium]|nr:alkaline phosphatase family protein [Chthoniobacterales bacterium]